MLYRIGVDTGGTFTDVTLVNETSGERFRVKTPTTPHNLSKCFIDGIEKVVRMSGVKAGSIEAIFHGTTFTTNLVLEQKFNNLGLIVTDGYRHILEIARQTVPGDLGDIANWIKPERPVPLENVEVAKERITADGQVELELDEGSVRDIARRYKEKGITSISVCFLHSYRNPLHENRVRAIFEEEFPECFISLSSDVLPEFREYERTATTLINSFVVPYMRKYRTEVETRIQDAGIRSSLYIMKSSGGSITSEEAVRKPIVTALSGPAAGVIGATHVCGLAGYKDLITFDMGGTSTDICLVEDGTPRMTTEGRISIYPTRVPMLDVVSIGAGGGSIAWVSPGKALRVGPQSAGAFPGPACYDQGGDDPAITDANLVLGRISTELLGGEFKLNKAKAEEAVARLGSRLALDPVGAAAGILEIATWNLINGVRQVTTRKGLDPRDYGLVAFGGAGPLHAWRVAELLGIRTVIVPSAPGVLASTGLFYTDLKEDSVSTLIQREHQMDVDKINRSFTDLEARAVEALQGQGIDEDRIRISRLVDMRYAGQAYETKVNAPPGPYSLAEIKTILDAFHRTHEKLYGYHYRGRQTVELVNLRIRADGVLNKPPVREIARGETGAANPHGSRNVFFSRETGFVDCPIFKRDVLKADNTVQGPAIIEEYDSTTLVPPEKKAVVDRFGNLMIT